MMISTWNRLYAQRVKQVLEDEKVPQNFIQYNKSGNLHEANEAQQQTEINDQRADGLIWARM